MCSCISLGSSRMHVGEGEGKGKGESEVCRYRYRYTLSTDLGILVRYKFRIPTCTRIENPTIQTPTPSDPFSLLSFSFLSSLLSIFYFLTVCPLRPCKLGYRSRWGNTGHLLSRIIQVIVILAVFLENFLTMFWLYILNRELFTSRILNALR